MRDEKDIIAYDFSFPYWIERWRFRKSFPSNMFEIIYRWTRSSNNETKQTLCNPTFVLYQFWKNRNEEENKQTVQIVSAYYDIKRELSRYFLNFFKVVFMPKNRVLMETQCAPKWPVCKFFSWFLTSYSTKLLRF